MEVATNKERKMNLLTGGGVKLAKSTLRAITAENKTISAITFKRRARQRRTSTKSMISCGHNRWVTRIQKPQVTRRRRGPRQTRAKSHADTTSTSGRADSGTTARTNTWERQGHSDTCTVAMTESACTKRRGTATVDRSANLTIQKELQRGKWYKQDARGSLEGICPHSNHKILKQGFRSRTKAWNVEIATRWQIKERITWHLQGKLFGINSQNMGQVSTCRADWKRIKKKWRKITLNAMQRLHR